MNRNSSLQKIEQEVEWDIIIIGGGATGLGCAVDAASRGYKTLLIEQYDFAKGTSSKATKLVHGGVRYLAQGNIKLVKEALKERGVLLKNAPHVCHVQSFIIPCYSWWLKFYYGIGLKMYDLLAGKLGLGNTKIVSAKYVFNHLHNIKKEQLKGGIIYTDGQFDDARLAINLAQTADEQGATVINYCSALSFIFNENKITGIVVKDTIENKEYQIKAKVVINATGVFADAVMKLANDVSTTITPSQGVHIVIDKKHFSGANALMIPKTTDDRVLFAVPWHDKVIVGTTDTEVNTTSIEPIAQQTEINFIINNFNEYAATPITLNDVRSIFTGLRPLVKKEGVKKTAALNRHHAIIISPSNLITITGGKWTTYRKMAEDTINNAAYLAKLAKQKTKTNELKIHGYSTTKCDEEFLQVYGLDAALIKELIVENPEWQEKVHPNYPFIIAQLIWAMRYEMIQTVEDFLARRMRLLFLDTKAAVESTTIVASVMRKEMNKTTEWEVNQINLFTEHAKKYQINSIG